MHCFLYKKGFLREKCSFPRLGKLIPDYLELINANTSELGSYSWLLEINLRNFENVGFMALYFKFFI